MREESIAVVEEPARATAVMQKASISEAHMKMPSERICICMKCYPVGSKRLAILGG